MSKALSGKVVLITGANTGIGRETALELARRGARVILACRSSERARPVVDELAAISAEPAPLNIELDLGSFESVRGAAARFKELGCNLDVLINNAGLAGHRGVTADGFEIQFGVNHLGHFLLTALLADKLIASAPSRVVTVASRAHMRAKGIDFEAVQGKTASVTGYPEYQVSKLANVLFTDELARRLGPAGVTAVSLHPGVIASDVWRRVPWPFRSLMKLFMKDNVEGAQTSIHCATADDLENGGYYDESRLGKKSKLAREGAELAAELWDRSVEWTGEDIEAAAA